MTRVERQPLLWRPRRDEGPRSRVVLAARVLAAVVLSALSGLVVVAIASQAVGFSAHVVTSGSMAPRVEPGDVVLTRTTTAADLHVGQVLLFADPERPGGLLLHRLVSFDPTGKLITRGDANQSDDSVHVMPSAVHGVAAVRVPWIGLPAVWRAQGRFGLIALAAALLGGAAVFVHSARGRRASTGSDLRRERAEPGSSLGLRPPMTAEGAPAAPRATARPATWAVHDTRAIQGVVAGNTQPSTAFRGSRPRKEERGDASSAGYFLPPVPRPAHDGDCRAGSARPARVGHGRGGDHVDCFDGGRLCGQPRQ